MPDRGITVFYCNSRLALFLFKIYSKFLFSTMFELAPGSHKKITQKGLKKAELFSIINSRFVNLYLGVRTLKKETKEALGVTAISVGFVLFIGVMIYVAISDDNRTVRENQDRAGAMLKNAGLQIQEIDHGSYNDTLIVSKATDKSKAIIVVYDYRSGLFVVTYPAQNKLISLPREYEDVKRSDSDQNTKISFTAKQLNQLFE